jgi:peptidoglycan hydrolase CwlO-like protein
MLKKLLIIKEKNRFLYFVFLLMLASPLVLFFLISIFFPALRNWLITSAQKLIDESLSKDAQIKKEINDVENKIEKINKKNNDLQDKIGEIKNSNDADWNKKK